ncbi:MAG: chromosome partitioning protein ParA, partial [Sulfobacillus sp.]|nr:chromosome partitioning protein ParA [Sulfobacillus sp.]
MSQILGYALGPIDPELHRDLTEKFPARYLSDWAVREAGVTTDALVANGLHTDHQPWTVLLVTPYLQGHVSLSQALILLREKWPALRIAVLVGEDHEAIRPFIAKLAAYQIYNVLVADHFQYNDLVDLITQDWPWERI